LQQIGPLISMINNDDEECRDKHAVIRIAMSPVIAEQWVSTHLPLFRKRFQRIRLYVFESDTDGHDDADITLAQGHMNDETFFGDGWCFIDRDDIVAVCKPTYFEMSNLNTRNWVEQSCLLESRCDIIKPCGISWALWLAEQGMLGVEPNETVTFESSN